ncbi:MAG: DMT family transporter [Gammaproteobacteria bacterium]|jgi:drug/metabolite transporter (DMT)-like permease|nr:DMT family transporter [Gammaproteobacteria bacterium]MBT3723726.1 DMT family transporter [Gammaproteobacteria bacterium]MBT4076016.1 DMT family transporter [Gammaproteobacteria bacterium]MBT4192942.1 DMT family transporter [Gammaproteobacteria bacterium]MBT4450539.1 DMT family transporter [Gammaproteobacteria bacterium]
MKPIYLIELVTLAALWGASFLFMRMGAPEFGPIVLIFLRTGIAAAFLLPVVVLTKKWELIKENGLLLFVVGVIGTAIPFSLLSYAVLTVSAGYASILNATAPIFTALIAWLWVKDELSFSAIIGLLAGFTGVIILTLDDQGGSSGVYLFPVLAGLGASFCYGVGANFTKQKLAHVHPLALACGSQLGATISLLPFSIWLWPVQLPGQQAWISVTLLGIACTAIAFILYFRLIANVGVNKAITVTYLIPFFGVVWGMIFLNETLTLFMLLGGLFILGGVALSTGIFKSKII